ncbi:MAG: hypothetical protein ABI852_04685 [Gemmatimonadaceae bacterium]
MTLMEAVVALVILALAGIGCLELAQGASNLEFSATEWNAAVTAAESRMAQVSVGAPADANLRVATTDSARTNHIEVTREPWRSGLEMITVSVPVTGNRRYTLRKLVANSAPRSASVAR